MVKVAINGMGRIGRAAFKILAEHKNLEIVAVNDLLNMEDLAYLINYDSVYRNNNPEVTIEGNDFVISNGKRCRIFSKSDPAQLPWKDLGVDIAFECTGIFTNKEGMENHLKAGARHVILSAPVKGNGIPTVVPGVNGKEFANEKMISTASCSTNCITPVVEIIGRRVGIKKANMTTVHAYTSTQELVDGPNKDKRRGRAAALNFIPTSTGAAKATTLILPQYKGRFDGMAIRGPVPAGSVADINFVTERETSVEEINQILTEEADSSRYKGILGVTVEGYVSSDIIKDNRAAVVDLEMTQVVDKDLVKIIAWYDNEWGYASQMIREAELVAENLTVGV